eukprot:3411441-Ditylum_brightwellii.AAC.1
MTREQSKRKEWRGHVPKKPQMERVIQKLQEKGAKNMHVFKGDELDENASKCKGNETPKGKRRRD